MGSSSGRVKPDAMQLLNVASQKSEESVKTGLLGTRIICPIGAIGLSDDCCFSELAL